MEEVEGVKKKSKKKESRYGKRYGFEVKLRRVGVSCGVRPAGYLDCPRFSDLTLLLPPSTVRCPFLELKFTNILADLFAKPIFDSNPDFV